MCFGFGEEALPRVCGPRWWLVRIGQESAHHIWKIREKRTSAGRVKEDPGRTVFTSSEDLAALEPRVETVVFSRSFTEAGDTIAAQELDPGDLGAQSLRTTTETKCTATVENEKCELSR